MAMRAIHTCDCSEHSWVPLTRGYVAIIDPEFAPAVGLWNWFASSTSQYCYAARSYHQVIGCRRRTITIRLHQMILPAPAGYVVDHANGNPLDNRIANLRLATVGENAFNQRARTNTASKYRGVTRAGNFWRATISKAGRQVYLGKFRSEADAAKAYDAAAIQMHGEFARVNSPMMRNVA